MLKKILTAFLLASLLIGPVFAETDEESILPDMSYAVLSEADGKPFLTQIYVKDGIMYLELGGFFWELGAADLEFMQSEITTHLEEQQYEELLETKEVGTAVIGEWETSHWQIFSKETGALVMEMWQAEDVFIPVKQISYDEEGKIISRQTLQEFTFSPDFEGMDFAQALPLSFFGEQESFSLTREEFQELVPWYDLNRAFPGGFELSEIQVQYRSSFELHGDLTLSYFNGQETIRLVIFGEKANWSKKPAPSDFFPLLSVSREGTRLEPAVKLENSNVILGFIDPVHLPTGESFLRSVVIFH